MRFTNLTRANEIGANCYHLQWNGHGCLVDCGLHPKVEGIEALPRLELLAGKPVDAVLISHGHLDHLGALPVVLRQHPEARVCVTQATGLIANCALHNSVSVMTKQRGELDLMEYPLFTHGEVDRLLDRLDRVPYTRPFEIGGAEITFFEAGHIQGAAGMLIQARNETVFYTGDIKFSSMRITRAARLPKPPITTMVMECTRGNTPSQPDFSWDREVDRLASAIQATYARGGSVLIPCFALGKTQEVLKLLYDLFQQRRLATQPIFISGLSRSYTEIYDELADHGPRVCPGFKLREKLHLEVLEPREGRMMKLGRGRLLLVSSGMMTPHTMSHRMAQRLAPDDSHAILFVGYVDPDSPAGKLRGAGQGGRVDFGDDAGEMDIQCQVDSFDFTSHCNREHMIECALRLRPRNIVLVHGDPPSLEWYRHELHTRLPGANILIPPSGETIEV